MLKIDIEIRPAFVYNVIIAVPRTRVQERKAGPSRKEYENHVHSKRDS